MSTINERSTDTEQSAPSTPDQGSRINWGAIIGLIVSGISLYIAVRDLQPQEVWRSFQQAQYVWIIPAVLLYLLALMARTGRWQALLASEKHIPFRDLLPTMAMGRGANNIYPFRTGEIVRVLLLRQRNGVSGAAGLASILVERVFDGLTMILFLILAALIGGIPAYLRYVVWAATGIFGAALASIYVLVLWPRPFQRVAEWLINRFMPKPFRPQLRGFVEKFIYSFSSVRSVLTLTMVLFFSVTVWSAETFSYWLLMNAFDFGQMVNVHQLLLMSSAANLGTALPSGPGNLGTFDAPAILVLSRIGIPENTAISYQTLLHAVLWNTETLYGLWFMWRSGIKKADLDQTLAEGTRQAA